MQTVFLFFFRVGVEKHTLTVRSKALSREAGLERQAWLLLPLIIASIPCHLGSLCIYLHLIMKLPPFLSSASGWGIPLTLPLPSCSGQV